jgi:hypothetical protein
MEKKFFGQAGIVIPSLPVAFLLNVMPILLAWHLPKETVRTEDLIELANHHHLYKAHARFLIKYQSPELWVRVLCP